MTITLTTGESFEVSAVPPSGTAAEVWDGTDASGQVVRFIRYAQMPGQLLLVRGSFSKGRYVTGFTFGE